MRYVQGFVTAVPSVNKDAYRKFAEEFTPLIKQFGATRVVEGWGDDVPDGKVTDFKRAVKARDDETVVFSWVEWSSKAVRDEGWKKVMADPRMQPDKASMPFDGQRVIYRGFTPIVDQ